MNTQPNLFAMEAEPASLAVSETPMARIDHFGAPALSDAELLALVLGPGACCLRTAHRVIAEAGSLLRLATWKEPDFEAVAGIGRATAARMVAAVEIARRLCVPAAVEPLMNRPELIVAHFFPVTMGLDVEKFWVCCLNRKNRLLKAVEITSGTATCSLAHPREVFRAAIREGATAVICVHNHPSGDPAPSAADIQVTRQLREAAKALDISLLDHIVIGRAECDPSGKGYYSFREAGFC